MIKDIDYKKPFYINSFDADEIIFNMTRGTHVKAVKYDGSLPVSLDSLQIRKLCGQKEHKSEFAKAFYETGKRVRKSFCDAVINVKFSEAPDLTDVATIREDLENGIKKSDLKGSIMEYPILGAKYKELLAAYSDNINYLKEREAGKRSKTDRAIIRLDGLRLCDGEYACDEVTTIADGTNICVKMSLTNDKGIDEPSYLTLYICKKAEDGTCDIIGTFASDDISAEPGKRRVKKVEFDIRDIMEAEDRCFIIRKGAYGLYVAGEDGPVPVCRIELPNDIVRDIKHYNPGWVDFEEWDITGVDKAYDDAPKVSISTGLQETFKKCSTLYEEILDIGCSRMVDDLNTDNRELKMRTVLYTNGFDFEAKDGTVRHYVVYKRSASKSKTGSCLFIWDALADEMRDWTWMGRYFDEDDGRKVDLTSIKAYEALTLSNIETSFRLQPKNVLIIEATEGAIVNGNRRIVCVKREKDENGDKTETLVIKEPSECESCPNKECRQKAVEHRNNIWDGQALLDESIFHEVYGNEKHGMMLLRNRFFKACAFNTKINEYYRENHIDAVTDMFGKRHKAEDVKLIITPDSLKYLKFAGELFGEKGVTEEEAKAKAYDLWSKGLKSADFGVVKCDKPQKRGSRHKVGYQILNTLPLTYSDMEKLFEHEKEYINLLWNDDRLFRTIIPRESAKGRFILRMCEMADDPYAAVTDDFFLTEDYISYKRQLISDIRRRMRLGAIDLEGEMLVLCSMPYEMLKYSGLTPSKRKKEPITPLLGPDEAFVDGLPEGTPVTLCRYPHLSAGSVASLTNRWIGQYTMWFNLRNTEDASSIVVISPYESNIMVKLGGADFDSDTALFIREKVIEEAAKKLTDPDGIMKKLSDGFSPKADGLPVAQAGEILKGDEKRYPLTALSFAILDRDLASTQSNIGAISNDIQLFNGYFWEALMSDKDSAYCRKIYECILKLSVLNELEIDRSKHSVSLKTGKVHRDIMETEYNGERILKAAVSSSKKIQKATYEYNRERTAYYQPAFLYEIKKDRGNENIMLRSGKDRYWNCPPDHLSHLAASIRKPRTLCERKRLDFRFADVPGKAVATQTEEIESMLKDTVMALSRIDRRRHKTGEESDERHRIQTDFAQKIAAMKSIPAKNIAAVIRDTMCMKDEADEKYYDAFMYRNRYRILGLLLMAEDEIDEKNKERGEFENPIRDVFRKIRIIDA